MSASNHDLHHYMPQYRPNDWPSHQSGGNRQIAAHAIEQTKLNNQRRAEHERSAAGTSNPSRNYPVKRKFTSEDEDDQRGETAAIKKSKRSPERKHLPSSNSRRDPPTASSHPEVVVSSDDSETELDDLDRVIQQRKQLSSEICEYCELHVQKEPDYLVKEELRRRLENGIREVYRRSDLVLVGSSLNGFGCRGSDADFCLLVTLQEVDQRHDARFMLDEIHQYMRANFSYVSKSCVIYAKVPIMRFTDRITGIECDININNITGIRNTHLLQAYSKVDRRVVPLVLWIKYWAKTNQINDASQGTLSSYSLVLLVLHYLQDICSPPVIPSLQESYPDTFNPHKDILRIHASLNGRILEPAIRFKSRNTESLGELLMGFFKHVAFFNFKKNIISVRIGSHFSLINSWRPQLIHIEEPFEKMNVARAVHKLNRFQDIVHKFKQAHETLRDDPRCYLDDLLSLGKQKPGKVQKTKRQKIKDALNYIKKKESDVKNLISFGSSRREKAKRENDLHGSGQNSKNESGPRIKWVKR
ncbi:hypothetical protein BSL78_19441 [Apostichopus japonicus]|uniref:Uncharacterized protein n=1 Tax=Stichopus japonicus TaxID=307972 RepID=A0A2G8K6R3_STIJA|nr:hypothetical protein BSL78_19441 [Apostichopus japonicus]